MYKNKINKNKKITYWHFFNKFMFDKSEKLEKLHTSVLLNELLNAIEIKKDEKNVILDCTLWMWWHAKEIIKKLNKWDIFIWFDADFRNLSIVESYLKKLSNEKEIELILINDNFVNIKKRLEERKIKKITWVYYDLWLSSLHIDEAERWFSFWKDWPLDMRFDTTKWITARDILLTYDKERITKILINYWEEPLAKKIANEIHTERRNKNNFEKTSSLVKIIEKFSNNPKTKARVFQALRIEVNKELEYLEKSLKDAIKILKTWWNIFVISFHSLEDRIVKNIFKNESKDCICSDFICTCNHKKTLQIITKKPITPTLEEIKQNIRSRSAKARHARKI